MAIHIPRQALALERFYDSQSMAIIAVRLILRSRQHLGSVFRRLALEALTQEYLALAQDETPSNSASTNLEFRFLGFWKGHRSAHRPRCRSRCSVAGRRCVLLMLF